MLFQFLVSVAAAVVDAGIFGVDVNATGPASLITTLALVVPALAVTVRRLHDVDRSGWWFLIVLVPLVGVIVLLVFTVQDSGADNMYGPSPKYPTRPTGYGYPDAAPQAL